MKHCTNILSAFLVLAAEALAGTHTVDPSGEGDFTSLTAALASPSVEAGDTLYVAGGHYVGSYLIDRELFLIAPEGPAATILDAGGLGPVLDLTAPVLVRGFGITGGGGSSVVGGINVASLGRSVIEQCEIYGNHPVGDWSISVGGIRVEALGSALIRDNVIRSNSSVSVGGVLTGMFAEVDLVRNRIVGNGGLGTETGGVMFGASGRLLCNQITGNRGTVVGGLYVPGGLGDEDFGSTVEIVNGTIYGNFAESPGGSVGGVLLDDGGHVTVVSTSILENFGTLAPDLYATLDFPAPPAMGDLIMSYSHLGTPGVNVPPGTFMLPGPSTAGFVDPAAATPLGPTTEGDFELTLASDYIDAGLDSGYPLGFAPADLSGGWRFVGGIDVGAEEAGVGCFPPLPIGIGKRTSAGTRMTLGSVGEPSVSMPGFAMSIWGGVPGKPCMLFYGHDGAWTPLGGHWLYARGPHARLGVHLLDASGATTFEIDGSPWSPGDLRIYQAWGRDIDHADGTDVALSNGLVTTFCD